MHRNTEQNRTTNHNTTWKFFINNLFLTYASSRVLACCNIWSRFIDAVPYSCWTSLIGVGVEVETVIHTKATVTVTSTSVDGVSSTLSGPSTSHSGAFLWDKKSPCLILSWPTLCATTFLTGHHWTPRRYTTMSNRCNTPGVWLGVCFLKWNRHCDPPSLLRLVGAISFLFKKS